MKTARTLIITVAVLVFAAGAAQAQLIVPLAGIQTFDGEGAAINTVQNHDVSPDNYMNSVAWIAVTGGTIGGSWASEAAIKMGNTGQTSEVNLRIFIATTATNTNAGPATGFAGETTYTFLPLGLDTDHILRLEYYETWVDVTGSPSFNFTGGELQFATTVPVELMSFSVN